MRSATFALIGPDVTVTQATPTARGSPLLVALHVPPQVKDLNPHSYIFYISYDLFYDVTPTWNILKHPENVAQNIDPIIPIFRVLKNDFLLDENVQTKFPTP